MVKLSKSTMYIEDNINMLDKSQTNIYYSWTTVLSHTFSFSFKYYNTSTFIQSSIHPTDRSLHAYIAPCSLPIYLLFGYMKSLYNMKICKISFLLGIFNFFQKNYFWYTCHGHILHILKIKRFSSVFNATFTMMINYTKYDI